MILVVLFSMELWMPSSALLDFAAVLIPMLGRHDQLHVRNKLRRPRGGYSLGRSGS